MAKNQTEMLVEIIRELGGEAKYEDIYRLYSIKIGKILTTGQKAGIRKNIEIHSQDSEVFKGTDLFRKVAKGTYRLVNSNNQTKKAEVPKSIEKDIVPDIIEYEPGLFISFEKLADAGVCKDDIEDFYERVRVYASCKRCFSIKKLIVDGITGKLDNLGFDEFFYRSLLSKMNDIFGKEIKGSYIYSRDYSLIDLKSIVLDHMEIVKKDTADGIINNVNDMYMLDLPHRKLTSIIKETELYYDEILELVYVDYETFYQDI